MNLDTTQWKEFTVEKLFQKLENGKANQGMLEDGNECFYIGAKRDDNGVMIYCARNEELIQKGNCIIFICNGQGSVGYANYMDVDFIGTTDIVAGYNENLNQFNGIFLATIFSQERPKYSFGRKWKTYLKNTVIKLPVKHDHNNVPLIDSKRIYSNEGYIPDWPFMENYIKSLKYKPISTANYMNGIIALDIKKWRFFKLKDICNISMGNKLDFTNMRMDNPKINFVGRSSENNGVVEKVDLIDNIMPYKKGCLTVALGGSLGATFIQLEDFYTSQNVAVLEFDNEVTESAKLFISCLIMNECKYRFYPFGRELNKHIKKDLGFLLPVKWNDELSLPITDKTKKFAKGGFIPDWAFMNDYIQSLPYGDKLK